MTNEKEPPKTFERLVIENPEAFDYEDCRPLRSMEEIGISCPPEILKMIEESQAKKSD